MAPTYHVATAHTSFKFGTCYTCRCVMMGFYWNKVDRKLKGQQGHDYCIIRAHQPNTIQLQCSGCYGSIEGYVY